MSTIIKERLPRSVGNVARLRVPAGVKPLHVGVQRGLGGTDEPMLWMSVDSDALENGSRVWLEVLPVYTGGTAPEDVPYLGTALLGGGSTVIHYFGRVRAGD